jgi:hypothetical protein
MKPVKLEVESLVIECGSGQLPDLSGFAQRTAEALRRLLERHGAPNVAVGRGHRELIVATGPPEANDNKALLADALAQILSRVLEEKE